MARKTGFTFYYDWKKPFKQLPKEDFFDLFFAMLEYEENGTSPPQFEGITGIVADFVFPQIARAKEAKANGLKGGNASVLNRGSTNGSTNGSSTNTYTLTNTNTNTDTNTNNTPLISPQGESKRSKEQFIEFWELYPKKQGKKTAEKAYLKLKPSPELHKAMLEALEKHKVSQQWQEESGKFIPLPTTWLNQERWNDELSPGKLVETPKTDLSDLKF